jgi:hypothetical protein
VTACTLATVAALCGCDPSHGPIRVPASYVETLSRADLSRALSCLRRLGLPKPIVVR